MDEKFVEKKRSDCLYLSKTFRIGREGEREARYVTRVFDETERSAFDFVDDEIVLRATHNDKVQVKAVVTTDDQQIQQLTIQSFRLYKNEGWMPQLQYGINLRGDEIARLLQFVQAATSLSIPATGRVRIDEEFLAQLDIDHVVREWLSKNPEAVGEITANQITSRDVIAVGYRKRELEQFARLLDDREHFDALCARDHGGSPERLWQAFFERNRWMFGYGLFYLSAEAFADDKLEQTVAGSTVATSGKRADALLRTRGRISSICLVEIKHHRTPLLRTDEYRAGAWAPSKELAGAVAQAQASVDGMERQFQTLLPSVDADGNPVADPAVIARPRSVVVCGALTEFTTPAGVNHPRFRSFELFRRHLVAPDVITFDELYERAKLITETSPS
jgi:hypothetical protein